MKNYMVTLKLERNRMHDPKNKVTGPCPLAADKVCTDVTGQHHTVFAKDTWMTPEEIAAGWIARGIHVTRIEEI
jgi:hypothetical protein